MIIDLNSIKPIYLQIAEGIEDDILNEMLIEGEKAYSQHQIANKFNINPATAAKGINLLVAEGILFKKRGLGMYVSNDAKSIIEKKRKNDFFSNILSNLLIEAEKLGITYKEIINEIKSMKGESNE